MKGLGRRRNCLDYRQVGARICVTIEKEESGTTLMGTSGMSVATTREGIMRVAEGKIKRGREGKELGARRQLKILLRRAKAAVLVKIGGIRMGSGESIKNSSLGMKGLGAKGMRVPCPCVGLSPPLGPTPFMGKTRLTKTTKERRERSLGVTQYLRLP